MIHPEARKRIVHRVYGGIFMKNLATRILLEHFNVGRDSSTFKSFRQECLEPPFFVTQKGFLKTNPKYEAPTPYDYGHFKEVTGMSTGDICRWLSVDNRNFNSMISQTGYEKGQYLPSNMWGLLIEPAGIVERLVIKPRFADVREEVLETSVILPTKHELYLLIGLSGRTIEDIAEDSGLDLTKLINNVHRGDTIINQNLEYVPPKTTHSLTKIHSATISLDISEWKALRNCLGIKNSSYITKVPSIKESALSPEVNNRSPYKSWRDKAQKGEYEENNVPLHELRQFYAAEYAEDIDKDIHSKVYRNRINPHFSITNVDYNPPQPLELRAILFWTGFTFGELSMLMGLNRQTLMFLASSRAINHSSRNNRTGNLNKPRTKTIRYSNWRRFLEAFNLVHQKQIRRTGQLD